MIFNQRLQRLTGITIFTILTKITGLTGNWKDANQNISEFLVLKTRFITRTSRLECNRTVHNINNNVKKREIKKKVNRYCTNCWKIW
ncbi:unnamed protein product [Rhizophagus irregularis]|nr:unnamed protein product [Rhizophagus irregularis]CAB4419762.1 unnamed protein product [Rhizophagus irregularis]